MGSHWRRGALLSLIALLLNVTTLFAQETITAAGSGIIAPVIEAAAETSGADVTISVVGTDRGISTFCAGETDLALAARALSSSEDLNCSVSGVQYLELLVGYNAIALISSTDSQFGQCLTSSELRTLFAPSAEGQVTDWSQVNPANPSGDIELIVPADTTPAFAALDTLVEGVGIRTDVTTAENDLAALSDVSANPNAIAVVSYANALAAGDSIRTLQLNTGTTGCTSPSIETIESRAYGAAERLFVYVNSASLSKAGLTDLLNAAFSEDAAALVSGVALLPPSAQSYATDQQILADVQTGRTFTRDVDAFTVPAGLIGTVNLGGATTANEYVQTVTAAFTSTQPGITLNQTYLGQPDGFRRLCNGEIDIAFSFSDMSAEQADNCAANNVTPYAIDLGKQAVVVVANAAAEYLTCLTTQELGTLWNATSAETVTNWNQVNAEFPDTSFILFAPESGSVYTDILLSLTAGEATASRADIELSDDPAYRAAATANVEGALTYMSWSEYQALQQSSQTGIQLVGVDSGNGCVTPSEATIADGSYALARPVRMLVNRAALARPEVQALVWYFVSDENFGALASNGIVGLTLANLADLRFALQETFSEVIAELAQIVPESTLEATPEVEPEAAPEATAEAAAEDASAADDAAPEATAEATETAG